MRAAVHREAAKHGLRVTVTPEEDARPRDRHLLFDQADDLHDPKWMHAKARCFRIMEGTGADHQITTAEAVKTANIPHLALEIRLLTLHYMLRHRLSRFNPFLGLSDVDAARKLRAMVFDICDRSTGKLGHWFTK